MDGNKRVVIADDEAITLYDLKERLEAGGYEVVGTASDGLDAIEQCRKHRPDVALLDIKMPLLDGLSAAKLITDEKYCTCIIILTAYSDTQFVKKASRVGVYGFLVKPVSDSTMLPTIEVAYKRSQEAARLRLENETKEKKLADSKFIERAKGYVMLDMDCSEDEAYQFMRKKSMDSRMQLVDIAREIISSHKE